jgi:hypothetical protein
MRKNRRFQLVVIGDSVENETNNRIAYNIGAFAAKQGWVLLNGGNNGVMQASSKGAFDNGGLAISILNTEDIDGGNHYSSVTIPTGIGWARNSVNVLAGDAVVAVGGKSGTLSEIALAVCYGKPVIAFDNSDGWSAKLAGERIDDRFDPVISVSSIEDFQREILKIHNRHKSI